jgi:hypothetical protein
MVLTAVAVLTAYDVQPVGQQVSDDAAVIAAILERTIIPEARKTRLRVPGEPLVLVNRESLSLSMNRPAPCPVPAS